MKKTSTKQHFFSKMLKINNFLFLFRQLSNAKILSIRILTDNFAQLYNSLLIVHENTYTVPLSLRLTL